MRAKTLLNLLLTGIIPVFAFVVGLHYGTSYNAVNDRKTPLDGNITIVPVEKPTPVESPINENKEDLRVKALEEQVQSLKAQVKALKKENKVLAEETKILPVALSCPIQPPQVFYIPASKKNHRLFGMAGYGVKGAKVESDGNQVWSEPVRGFVGGFGYQYTFDENKNIGAGTIGAETVFMTFGLDF